MQFKLAALAALAATVSAQRPNGTSICDYYTKALLNDSTAANQYKLLTLLVNTVIIGNYTTPNKNAVPGILAPGTYMGEQVNLAPYFTGALKSSNRGGVATSVNFLDGGGATPLQKNELPPTSSNQYKLVTHLYQFFGVLLGCSGVGTDGFPAYAGQGSQYQVHRFMDLDAAQVGYFVQQVGLAASSFGVAQDDITAAAGALNKLFSYRCSPPATVVPAQGAQLQSICANSTCPLDPNNTCSAYPDNGMAPLPVAVNTSPASNATMSSSPSATGGAGGVGTTSRAATATPSGPSSSRTGSQVQSTGAAATMLANAGAVVGGALAFAFAL